MAVSDPVILLLAVMMTPDMLVPAPWNLGVITQDGLLVLLKPLEAIGFNRERISVRLLLVLDHMAAEQKDWRALLYMSPTGQSLEVVSLPVFEMRMRDAVLSIVAVAAILLGPVIL